MRKRQKISPAGVDIVRICYNAQSMKGLIPLVLSLSLLGCNKHHQNWYLDTVATDGGQPGEARALVETMYGRTEWTIENGVLYVGDDSGVPKAIWGNNDAKSTTTQEDPGDGEEDAEPAAAPAAEDEIAGEPTGDPE